MEASVEKLKSRWTRSFFTALDRKTDDEKYICDICQKDLASPSNLALHQNTHSIERPYKCEPCQVSFVTQGHLQKHIRSSSHETRVAMTQAFGVPSSENPRPYGCTDCDTAFRKHGHLAKHLRSKSHITKLETNGLIPHGTYAAFEKSSVDIKDRLVTINSERSLESLRLIASLLFPDGHGGAAPQSSPLPSPPQTEHKPQFSPPFRPEPVSPSSPLVAAKAAPAVAAVVPLDIDDYDMKPADLSMK